MLTRSVFRVEPATTNTVFGQKFANFLNPYIYNKAVKECELQLLTVKEAKFKTQNWLKSMDYNDTEAILCIIK